MKKNTVILPTTYFGNIEYYATLLKYENILIEAHEHYVKQTFRNRCVIATANGPLVLTVPVNFSNTLKTKTKDVTIDYSKNWQKQHFKAIESAYRKSPYYEYYIDDFMFVFEKKEKFLLDLNGEILNTTCCLLKDHKKINLTDNYQPNQHLAEDDFENNFIPDKQTVKTKIYHQVFSAKFGFISNLSLIDLLFNNGFENKKYLINL